MHTISAFLKEKKSLGNHYPRLNFLSRSVFFPLFFIHMKSIYTVRSSMLLLLVLTMWIAAVLCQSPSNPAFWELPRRYNVSGPAEDRNSHERVAVSQDFQTIYAGSDQHQPTRVCIYCSLVTKRVAKR